MKNLKVKQFSIKVEDLLNREIEKIKEQTNDSLTSFNNLNFETFSNENPYKGSFENKIFFTYNNHYKYNSSTYMEVCKLNHPHTSFEDRGYIKGVATDLQGYLILKSANCIQHKAEVMASIYFPKSKLRDAYIEECEAIKKQAIEILDNEVLKAKDTLNERLKELTGCSLLYYLRNF